MAMVKIQPSFTSPSLSQPNCSLPFKCGNITAGYPFWGGDRSIGCGHPDLRLDCSYELFNYNNDEFSKHYDAPNIAINDVLYSILNIDEKAQTLRISRIDYLGSICSPQFPSTIINSSILDYDPAERFRSYGSLAPKRCNYSDIQKIKSFSNKLGQGGYGDVYKGMLPDGPPVAVKVLKESKGNNGEEFMNEVANISRTSNVNIVTLLGFCCQRNERALIYEFMPNGSLDKFIYDQESSSTNQKLDWKTKFQIAVGIARGLEYLHRGCSIRIVHFDIKPRNILLNEDFCPKISDFALAKQSKNKESILLMLEARGTIGYIAPEVYSRNFGGVSHKSDVYSYGIMILEIVGGKKNIDDATSHTGEIYSSHWLFKHLLSGEEQCIDLLGVVTAEEKEMAKKMIFVSLWCIQTFPSDRPSMTKVLEMLAGSLENLQAPPKPPTFSANMSPSKHIPPQHHQRQLESQKKPQ
ncbi:LEAF RUST 10 DISEASE-RESISTANCE LOCUS RECEPTOR-LIKE PROTEIN KINASE-like 2.4 [Mangifera indica]|uniref:LEAF RUST 10 DISEASE-RESISTANCE LOCUS RECEPTOR-LIKE PROTEIN KINASE-like 2.4 n=1 Tax=Mangifera indica TaxID=29780 RepID=UPI001CFA59CB|nr:LEAF RUST 10 DISEASE-RESISTANCE LOCUS RECEPTOR-LIKE PROTEIN KINASE-like 2.4 [Mangifera indica]